MRINKKNYHEFVRLTPPPVRPAGGSPDHRKADARKAWDERQSKKGSCTNAPLVLLVQA
jgi:hypothetical protein